ncbi:MAG: hypothetical protein NVSMB6_17710 [Burkholderiaceae bacterium]
MITRSITVGDLRELFKIHLIIQGNMKLPTQDGFHDLVAVTNHYIWLYNLAAGQWKEIEACRQAIARAIALIDTSVPELRKQLLEADNSKSPPTNIFKAELLALDNFKNATDLIKDHPYLMPFGATRSPRLERWHDYGPFIAAAFIDALEHANPGIKVQFSNTGPLSRFMRVAIDLISSEQPNGATVVQYLRKLKRNQIAKSPDW